MLMDDSNWQEVTGVLEDEARRSKREDRRQSEDSSCRSHSAGVEESWMKVEPY